LGETKNKKRLDREKMSSTITRLPLVAQEIKAKQKSHYDEKEEQGQSDNFIDIHYRSAQKLLIIQLSGGDCPGLI
jgi:hypothetical protein